MAQLFHPLVKLTRVGPSPPDDEEIKTVTISPYAGMRVTATISFAITLAVVIIYLLSGGGQAFRRSAIVRTYFPDGTGLVRTADVQLNGVKIGTVKAVYLSQSSDPKQAVAVEMKIKRTFLRDIPDDSRTEITAANLLDDKFINITKGQSPTPIHEGSELTAHPPPLTNFDPSDLFVSMQEILDRADELLTAIEDPATTLGQFVQTDDNYRRFIAGVVAVQASIHKMGSPKSQLGQAIYGEELYGQLRAFAGNLDQMLAGIQNGEGAGGHLYASTEQYDAMRNGFASVRKTVDGLRSSTVVKDDEMYRRFEASLKNLNQTIDAWNNGEGTLGNLLTSAQLYESLSGSGKSMEEFLRDFRNNPKKYLRLKVF